MNLPAFVRLTRNSIVFVITALVLASCGGGGGGSSTGGAGSGSGTGGSSSGGGSSTGGDNTNPLEVTLGANLGQALLGPIVDASVSVYAAENFDGTLICTTTTSSRGAPEGPGVVDLSTCNIETDSIYLIVVRGGSDIDAEDDGEIDASPTPKSGTIRALLTGEEIENGSFRINILTELAYQSIADDVLAGSGFLNISNRLDNVARILLVEDLNGDGVINKTDLLFFIPAEDGDAIAGNNVELLNEILDAILSGNRRSLANLARQYFLSATSEFRYMDLIPDSDFDGEFSISEVLVEDGLLYAAGYTSDSEDTGFRFFVFDISDFSNIVYLGKLSFENLVSPDLLSGINMVKEGNNIYVVSKNLGMLVLDVTDPASPSLANTVSATDYFSVEKGPESYLYVGALDFSSNPPVTTIYVYDISVPEQPVIVGSISGYTAFDMHYEDSFLYVYGDGVQIFDVSIPDIPVHAGGLSFSTGSGGESDVLVYADGFVYLSQLDYELDSSRGLAILDVRDPANVIRTGFLEGIGVFFSLFLDGNRIYIPTDLNPYENSSASLTITTFEITSPGNVEIVDSRAAPRTGPLELAGNSLFFPIRHIL